MNAPPRSLYRSDMVSALTRLLSLVLAGLIFLSPNPARARQAGGGDETRRVLWKPVTEAQVKLDDKTPLAWNIYQPDKKDKKKGSDLVLLLLGHRYLFLDINSRLVYLVPLSSIQAKGDDFESGDLAQNNQLIPTTDWTLRDVGPAELIHLTLGDYGRALEISLPHPPDLRPFY